MAGEHRAPRREVPQWVGDVVVAFGLAAAFWLVVWLVIR